MYIVVVFREVKKFLFFVMDGLVKFVWVFLKVLFLDLFFEVKFVGWKKVLFDVKKLDLEKVDEKYMFEIFFFVIYWNYVRILLYFFIVVKIKIVKRVDFCEVQVKVLEFLFFWLGMKILDVMFYFMIIFCVFIGVLQNGQFLVFLLLLKRLV